MYQQFSTPSWWLDQSFSAGITVQTTPPPIKHTGWFKSFFLNLSFSFQCRSCCPMKTPLWLNFIYTLQWLQYFSGPAWKVPISSNWLRLKPWPCLQLFHIFEHKHLQNLCRQVWVIKCWLWLFRLIKATQQCLLNVSY